MVRTRLFHKNRFPDGSPAPVPPALRVINIFDEDDKEVFFHDAEDQPDKMPSAMLTRFQDSEPEPIPEEELEYDPESNLE